MIFKHFVESFYRAGAIRPGFGYRWVVIFLVCRRWHNTALATAALFRYIDFNRLKSEAVLFWIDHAGLADLCVWVPKSYQSPALTLALAHRPEMTSRIKQIYLDENVGDEPWTEPSSLAGVADIYMGSSYHGLVLKPVISTFLSLRRLYFHGSIMASTWRSGLFPATLECLELCLAPIEPDSSDEEIVSTASLVASLNGLPFLRYLSLSMDLVVDEGYTASVSLPSLRSLSLKLRVSAFPIICGLLIPSQLAQSDVIFRPYARWAAAVWSDEMVSQFAAILKDQGDRFTTAVFDICSAEITLTLMSSVGRSVSIEIIDGGDHLKSVIGVIDTATVVNVGVLERPSERNVSGIRWDNTRTRTLVLEGMSMFINAERLDVKGDVGSLMTALCARLTSGGSRHATEQGTAMGNWWARLRKLRFISIRRNEIPLAVGTVEDLIESFLEARKSMGYKVQLVEAYGCDFKLELVSSWAMMASTVVTGCEHFFKLLKLHCHLLTDCR